MCILNTDIEQWAGLTKYVIYGTSGAFDVAHAYTLSIRLVLYQPLDHTPHAINLVKHELTNIKWFIVALWPTLSCALTFDGVC